MYVPLAVVALFLVQVAALKRPTRFRRAIR